MSKKIAGDEIRVSKHTIYNDAEIGHKIVAIGDSAAKETKLRVGERLCSSDLDELSEAGYFVKEQR